MSHIQFVFVCHSWLIKQSVKWFGSVITFDKNSCVTATHSSNMAHKEFKLLKVKVAVFFAREKSEGCPVN